MVLSQVLKELRTAQNLTKKQLAEATGLSIYSIISYENGRREPNGKAMAALERYFGVSGEYLRGEVTREDFLKKSAALESNLDVIVHRFEQLQASFRIADQDQQTEAVAVLQVCFEYIIHQLQGKAPHQITLKECKELLDAFEELTPAGAAEMVKRVQEYGLLEAAQSRSQRKNMKP